MNDLDALTHLLHEAVLDYSQTDGWPIVGDDLPAAEWLAGYLSARWNDAG